MNLRDYYLGKRVTLRSPLRPDEIKQRLRDSIRVDWWQMPFRTGPVGAVRWGRLRLRYVSSFFEYNSKPILAGRVERTTNGSILRLAYRGQTWSRLFFLFWYGILALLSVLILTGGAEQPLQGADRIFPFLVIGGMAVIPVAMHIVGTRQSADDLEQLLEFLGRVAEAKPSRE